MRAIVGRQNAPDLIADMVVKLRVTLSRDDAAVVATVARWHSAIARDVRRNNAYDRALRAGITSDSIVLEVGTGSGILAMMAARAGAAHIYTIEMVPLIAAAARENIRRNGFEDRITVICAYATNVTVGDQLPQRSNVFLHEIVSNDLLGEHVLPIVAYARAALLTPDALHLPDQIWMTCQLANMPDQSKTRPLGEQAGFDLSAMDIFQSTLPLKHGPLDGFVPLSERVEVLRFDLTGQEDDPMRDEVCAVDVTRTANANAIVQWIGFSFPDGTRFTNPPDQFSCWALRVWPIPDQSVCKGDTFQMRRRYDDVRAMPMPAALANTKV